MCQPQTEAAAQLLLKTFALCQLQLVCLKRNVPCPPDSIPAGGCGLSCGCLQEEVLPLEEKVTSWEPFHTRETRWGWRLTSGSLSSAAFWSSVFHGNPASSNNAAVNPCLIPPPSHLSGKLMMQLGMLTKCICAGEQRLMKIKTFRGKSFLILKRAFYCIFLLDHKGKQLQQKNPRFCRSLVGWKTWACVTAVLCLIWYQICAKNNRSNRKGLLRKTQSHPALRGEKEYLTSWHFS